MKRESNKSMIKLFSILLCFSILAQQTFAQTKEARKIAELQKYDCEELKLRSYDFRTEMDEDKDSKGYVIVYDGNDKRAIYDKNGHFERDKYIYPMLGQLNSRVRGIRGMFQFINAPLKRIKIIKGGFRDNFAIEFWIVPNGAEPPKPTPTLKKIKYRKGKIYKFVYLNC